VEFESNIHLVHLVSFPTTVYVVFLQEVAVDTEVVVLLDGGHAVEVEEELLADTPVGSALHVLGEFHISSNSESDRSAHELLDTFLPGSGEHGGVLHVDLGQCVGVVVSKGSEFVWVVQVTPDGAFLVDVVLTFKSDTILLFLLEVVSESDSSGDITVNDPELVEDIHVVVGPQVRKVGLPVGVQVHLSSLSEGFTTVMEGHVVSKTLFGVVPDHSVAEVSFVFTF